MPVQVGNLSPGWQYELVNSMDLGVNLADKPETIRSGECTVAENVYFRSGKVYIDTGYVTFGQVVEGVPRVAYQLFKTDGTDELLLLTNSSLYVWNNTVEEWQFIASEVSTTLDANAAMAATILSVTDETGFSDGDMIGVVLNDNTMHMTTVNGTPTSGEIVITDGLPSASDSGNSVVRPAHLSGNDDLPVDAGVYVPSDWFVFTNAVDNVQYYDGDSVQDIPNLPESGNTQCHAIGFMGVYLLLLNTTEGAARHPQRIRWCETADPTNWTTGNAGFEDLLQSEDHCTAFAALGPYGIIYKERSIARMQLVGTDDRLFQIDQHMVVGEGVLSPAQVVNLNNAHVFRGRGNIYQYEGGFDIVPIADKVFEKMFSAVSEPDPTYINRSFLVYVEELNEVWVYYTKSGDTWPKNILRYNLHKTAISFREMLTGIAGYGFYTRTDDVAWEDLEGTWEAQEFIWGSAKLLANSPNTLLCDAEANQVLEYDYIAATDDGELIPFVYETHDFFNPYSDLRLDTFEIYGSGGEMLIEYSIDEGNNWQTLGTVTLTSAAAKYRVFNQVLGDRFRFRFSGSGGGLVLHWYGFTFSLESLDSASE